MISLVQAMSLKKFVKPLVPKSILNALQHRSVEQLATRHGLAIRYAEGFIELSKGDEVLRLGYGQQIYIQDCIQFFDFYFHSVKPLELRDRRLADFSGPRYHKVIGFDHFPILFPSIPEPYATLEQYLSFAQLKAGDVVFDLGVYVGLTSLVFSRLVGPEGAVYGFEADVVNFKAASENFETARHCGAPDNITLVNKAVWCHEDGLDFSSEGAMGSSAASIVGAGRGTIVKVPTTTLAAFCSKHGIHRVDFIKMDIEGAEIEVLESSKELLSQLKPRLIIEPHYVGGQLTANRCCEILEKIGYTTQIVDQQGASIPLIEASPQFPKA